MNGSSEPDKPASAPLVPAIKLSIQGIDLQMPSIGPVVKSIGQFVSAPQLEKIRGGLGLPFPHQLALAVHARIGEFLTAQEPVVHAMVFPTTIAATTSFGHVVVTAEDLASASDNLVVEVSAPRAGVAGVAYGQWLFLAILWLVMLAMPIAIVESKLSPDAYYGLLGNVAVAITFDILGKRNKR